MQLRQIEYVASLVQWKTMRKAAQHLYVTEATISQQIRELEAELGFPLFEREGRTLKLAPQGEKLLPIIQQILHTKREFEEQVAEIKVASSEGIRFGIVPSPARAFLPSILTTFHSLYPQVKLEVREAASHDLIAQMYEGKLDVAVIAFSELVPFHLKGMVIKTLFRTELVALASCYNRLATKEQVTKAHLAQERLIVYREGFLARDLIFAVLGAEIEENIIYSTDNHASSLKLAMSDAAILFLPWFVVTRYAKKKGDFCLLNLAEDVTFPLGYAYIYPAQRYLRESFQVFLATIREQCQVPDLHKTIFSGHPLLNQN